MFTGIVQGIGRIATSAPRGDGLRITVDVGALSIADIRQGDSIAVAGCCLTVVEKGGADGSTRLDIDTPAALARFIAPKGSIAVDGVSLTVNAVAGQRFAVNLIPHTLAVTTLGELAPGARVNLEVDVIARYVARLQETP